MADLITTSALTKRFNGLTAVHAVDFRVREGETTGVIGPNGSGKTTLFHLLSGFFPPTEGEIRFCGEPITALSPHRRVALGIARTFQLVSVFSSLTVWENAVLAVLRFQPGGTAPARFFLRSCRHPAVLERCAEALERVGLTAQASFPVAELSYGDKRMLEIGITLALHPRLLLLDEPLAGLSDHEIARVVELIREIRRRFTVVIIEHKISKILELVERLSVMNEGRLIREGTPSEVLSDPRVRECYWGKEAPAC